jgi:hypothetical protein
MVSVYSLFSSPVGFPQPYGEDCKHRLLQGRHANCFTTYFNHKVAAALCLPDSEEILWLSPMKDDAYAEYFDQAFLDLLGLNQLRHPLKDFWPPGGPRWDGLARTSSGKVILVEAKAHIEEAVSDRSKASSRSLVQINHSLAEAKRAFNAREDASWESPFYQYANRLAHLYFIHTLNNVDAYLLFLYFADAPDVPSSCTAEQWQGAIRLTKKCLGLGANPYQRRVAELILSVPDMQSGLADPRTRR